MLPTNPPKRFPRYLPKGYRSYCSLLPRSHPRTIPMILPKNRPLFAPIQLGDLGHCLLKLGSKERARALVPRSISARCHPPIPIFEHDMRLTKTGH